MMRFNLNKAIALMALFFCTKALAQTDDLGSWTIFSAKKNFNAKWYGFAETQFRSQKMYSTFYYNEYKGGVGYNISKDVNVLVAMGHYVTYQSDGEFKLPVATDEVRTWQQLTVVSKVIHRVSLEHRYRTEQRWINGVYRNRFRYRANAIIPINHSTVTTKTWYASVYDEVFFTNEDPYFERNRFLAGIGYEFTKALTIQTSWIRQFDYHNTSASVAKNFLQASLMLTFGATRERRERHPTTED